MFAEEPESQSWTPGAEPVIKVTLALNLRYARLLAGNSSQTRRPKDAAPLNPCLVGDQGSCHRMSCRRESTDAHCEFAVRIAELAAPESPAFSARAVAPSLVAMARSRPTRLSLSA